MNDMRTRLALALAVFDGEIHPQTLIRLGSTPVDGPPQPPTERRPVSETTVWAG